MSMSERPYLRLHREPGPLGAYVRPLERDYTHMAKLISAGFSVGTGVVIDACHPGRSRDLRSYARDRNLEVVLDPRSIELSTEGGIQRSGVLDLPWSSGHIDTPNDLTPQRISSYADSLARTAVELNATAVLAPSHYLEAALTPWFDLDLELTSRLRAKLNEDSTGREISIYYPLASSLTVLQPDSVTSRVVRGLTELSARGATDAIWMRMHSFGSNSAGPLTVPRYLRLARKLHPLGLPVVAERTGTVGLPLMAFGAVVGIESGVTHGDRFDFRALKMQRTQKPGGGSAPRVYLPAIGVFLKRKEAQAFLNTRGVKGTFGCQLDCCPRGVADMISDARKHFLVTRSREVAELARVPESMRVEHFFSTWLRVAGDRAIRAARVVDRLDTHRKRLDMWRATFTTQAERDLESPVTTSPSLSRRGDRGAGRRGGVQAK